ncbi:hypothetical protein KAR02_02800 [Candidatus Bipolaricaulota bacterium]|nr:hypothetical protein [Candidatus Bipolaricaulota bacterium]
MISRKLGVLWIIVIPLSLAVGVLAQIPLMEYEQALYSIPVSNPDFILFAMELGMTQEDFPAQPLLQLIDRLANHQAPPFEKEAILLVLAHALEDGLPIESLINKAFEGLARGVPLQQIEQGLSKRLTLLAETWGLLLSKGILSVPAGSPQTVTTAIPTLRFNQLLIHVSETIGDFLEGGGSPFDGHVLYQEVRNRLTMLQGVTLLPEDVELVLERIGPSDLTRVAQKI